MYSSFKDGQDREDRDDELDRSGRFVEQGEDSEMLKSKSLNDMKSFYNGQTLDERMAEIRKSIVFIRQHWDQYDTFIDSLRELMQEGGMQFKDPQTVAHAEAVLSKETKRDWMNEKEAQDREPSYDAIKLYTSKEGYAQIYRVSNDIFRQESSVSVTEKIRSVVFLVELINIDLFNYCLRNPLRTDFEGSVYRGMCLSSEDLGAYEALRKLPIAKRNIAVPLGLLSASANVNVARKFIKHQMKQRAADKDNNALIMKINVIGLKPEYMEHYRKTFTTTVLSTICAVDIHELSRHKDEKEVLLRGPFFLVLDFYKDDELIDGKPCNILEIVMLNANRDHISTAHLGDKDAAARDMFGTMVTVTRSEYAVKYCERRELVDDADEYRKILNDSKEKLDRLMKVEN